jgi:hypothetical protein
MKKRLPILIFSVVYLVSLVAGFSFAGMRQEAAGNTLAAASLQDNWILVRVDDMTLEHPQLVSVWAMFLSFAPGPQIFFKPIYAADWKQTSYSSLSDSFTVSAERSISDNFIRELDRLNFHRSGLLILDDLGFQSFSAWINPSQVAGKLSPFIPVTNQEQAQLVTPEVQSYQAICAALVQKSPRTQALSWQSLYPNHVLPHPSLESLVSMWERIISANQETHCEVITGQ